MSFTGDLTQYQRWDEFQYYSDEDGTDGNFSESLSNPGSKIWKIKDIRMHWSTAFASVEDLVVNMSSILGSYHDHLIASEAMNGVQDLLLQFSNPITLFSDDTVVFAMSMKSNINHFGLIVNGWAVRG